MPGYSQSFLKTEQNGIAPGITITDNMKLGSMVDSILTEPYKVDVKSPFYNPGRQIAVLIKNDFGPFINRFEKQVSYTATACYEGWEMAVRGRLDFGIPNRAVLDLKVTKDTSPDNVYSLIKHMGYDNQLYSYCKFYGVKQAYLIIHFVKYKITKLYSIDVTGRNEFWEDKIIKFGVPVMPQNVCQ